MDFYNWIFKVLKIYFGKYIFGKCKNIFFLVTVICGKNNVTIIETIHCYFPYAGIASPLLIPPIDLGVSRVVAASQMQACLRTHHKKCLVHKQWDRTQTFLDVSWHSPVPWILVILLSVAKWHLCCTCQCKVLLGSRSSWPRSPPQTLNF